MRFSKIVYTTPFVLFLLLWGFLIADKKPLRADRDYYRHYHIASFEFDGELGNDYRLVVFRKNKPLTGIGGRMVYRFNVKDGKSTARFPIPWNAEEGFYEARVFHPSETERNRFLGAVFAVTGRKAMDVKFPLNAMNWENTKNLKTRRIPAPSGEIKSWKGIFDWLDYMKTDTLFYLTAQTAFFGKSLPADFPWIKNNLKRLDDLCAEAHKRKMRIGAWAASYIVVGKRDESLGYTYGTDYSFSDDRLKKSRGISIGDSKRLKDIIKVMRRMDTSSADFLGLDYIRPVQGGFELIDEFLEDMDVELPAGLKGSSGRALYLAREIFRKKNYALRDLWNWWRARKSSLCIERIKEEVKSDKPLWIFLLSWQMGHQHGQDPVMFRDAGADFQTVMLYECDDIQFDTLLSQWEKYDAKGVNFIIGNQIDFNVHQFSEAPPAPEKFASRLLRAREVLKPNGVFINDLSRVFWGRKGPYTGMEWLAPVKSLIETGEIGTGFLYSADSIAKSSATVSGMSDVSTPISTSAVSGAAPTSAVPEESYNIKTSTPAR
ncbi:MAG: hypothetical protein U9O97_01410 [Elusimicrobiota bacterium]|nr:hypothetical protein [Elusimicrobiota bacterium]